jgi:hypothetical protein
MAEFARLGLLDPAETSIIHHSMEKLQCIQILIDTDVHNKSYELTGEDHVPTHNGLHGRD